MKTIPHLKPRIWSLLDQICFSAANFILMVCLARYYSDIYVAGYGIGLSIAMMVQSTQRNTYVVQNAVLAPGIIKRRASAVMGQHFTAWGAIIVLEIFVAGLLSALAPMEDYTCAIILSMVVCTLLYAQLDLDRSMLAKYGRMKDACVASVAFVLLVGALFFAIPTWELSYVTTMLLIGGYAIAKIIRLVVIMGLPDFVLGGRLARRSIQKYLGSSVLGVLGASGHSHGPLFILGFVSAPIHSAVFVAMRGLMQPLMVVVRSLDVIDKSLVQAQSDNSYASLRRNLFRQLTLYTNLAFAAIIGVFLLGEWAIEFIYGDQYNEYSIVLVGWAMIFLLMSVAFPIETVVVKIGRLKRYNTLRLASGAVGVLLAMLFCPRMGVNGALWACIAGWALCVFTGLWVIRHVLFQKKFQGRSQ